ncbi:MAG: hypothetical protein E7257_03760 [Lachnospiraceae bacterium]|nr:hypothetical protein [Lachnospiraceae bacterium]
MPGILLSTPILRKFPGSGDGTSPICPGFCRRLQFPGIFRAVVVGISLYARDFAPEVNSKEISGQWWWEFSYMPGISLPRSIPRKFLGNGDSDFPICPGFYSKLQFPGNFRAVAVSFSPYAQILNILPSNKKKATVP